MPSTQNPAVPLAHERVRRLLPTSLERGWADLLPVDTDNDRVCLRLAAFGGMGHTDIKILPEVLLAVADSELQEILAVAIDSAYSMEPRK